MAKLKIPGPLLEALRDRIRDYAETNELIGFQQESSDRQLAGALVSALREWNSIPFYSAGLEVRFANFVDADGDLIHSGQAAGVMTMILERAAARVLESVSTQMMRNDLEYAAGSVTVRDQDKWRHFFQTIIPQLNARFEEGRIQIRGQQNMQGAWGGTYTEMVTGQIRLDDAFDF